MFYDMQSGGRCEREGDVCVNCEVYAEPMTPDMFAGEENEECRNQVRLGLSEDAVIPSWNFRPGPCPSNNSNAFLYDDFNSTASIYGFILHVEKAVLTLYSVVKGKYRQGRLHDYVVW